MRAGIGALICPHAYWGMRVLLLSVLLALPCFAQGVTGTVADSGTGAPLRGAVVTLISGPTSLPDPIGINVQRVETAEQMASAVRESIRDADALIMAAAVADFRPANVAGSKIKKQAAVSAIELEPAPDILKSTRDARATQLRVVGFALETDAHEENARKKLAEKGLDFIVLNDAREPGAGFEVDTNKVTILRRDSDDVEHLPLLPKNQVADAILDRLAALY